MVAKASPRRTLLPLRIYIRKEERWGEIMEINSKLKSQKMKIE